MVRRHRNTHQNFWSCIVSRPRLAKSHDEILSVPQDIWPRGAKCPMSIVRYSALLLINIIHFVTEKCEQKSRLR